jgi:GDP-L-fucose synthase
MPTNLYGPGDNFNLRDSHVLPALVRKFVEAEAANLPSISLWGTGSPLRDFLHVDDLARAVLLTSEKYDQSLHLNVGSGHEISVKDLAFLVAQAAGFKGEIVWDSSKPDGTPRKLLDVTKISALGWRPTITLAEGIKKTIAWYQESVQKGEARL